MFGSKSRLIRSLNDQLEAARGELHRSDIMRDRLFGFIEEFRVLMGVEADCSLEKEVQLIKDAILSQKTLLRGAAKLIDPKITKKPARKKKKH